MDCCKPNDDANQEHKDMNDNEDLKDHNAGKHGGCCGGEGGMKMMFAMMLIFAFAWYLLK